MFILVDTDLFISDYIFCISLKCAFSYNRKRQDCVYGKGEHSSTWQKIKHYLRRENKANIKIYANIQKIKNNKKVFPLCQTYKPTVV